MVKKNSPHLTIKNLSVSVEKKQIIKNISLIINRGEVHAVMGPNGSGKSSFAYALMGHPNYKVGKSTRIRIDGVNISDMEPEKRAKKGLFLAFQNPIAVAGVRISHFLRSVYKQVRDPKVNLIVFQKRLEGFCKQLGIDKEFLERSLNDGFSGGERKKLETLQLLTLKPCFIIIDEIDTGLDIDSLKNVSQAINNYARSDSKPGVLIISHYQRIFNYIKPDIVHILVDGKIVKTGKHSLISKVEEKGYARITRK